MLPLAFGGLYKGDDKDGFYTMLPRKWTAPNPPVGKQPANKPGYKAVVRACCYCRGVEASSPQAWHCVTLY